MIRFNQVRHCAAVVGILLIAVVIGGAPGEGDALTRISAKDEPLPDGTGRTVTMIGHLRASPEELFAVISDYGHYAELIPDITQVKVLPSPREGVVVVSFRYFVLMIGEFQITREFTHHGTSKIDFKTLDGGLGEMWGSWDFQAELDTRDTKVTYTASIRPKVKAPEVAVKYVLRNEAKQIMEAALEEVQSRAAAKSRQGG